MDYEAMVKTAYEEIIGIEKEAAPKKRRIEKDLDYFRGSKAERKLVDNAIDRSLIRGERADVLAKMKELKKQGKKDSTEYQTLRGKNSQLKGERNRKILSQMNPFTPYAASTGRIATSPSLYLGNPSAAYDMQSAHDQFLVERYNKRKAERAEKAAAYYDEAQLAKEAAEADYAEACAYEDAALAILDELGYLED